MKLAKEGCDLSRAARSEAAMQDLQQDLTDEGAFSLVTSVDLTDGDDRGALVNRTIDQFGRVDLLANNAGVGSMEKYADIEWDDVSHQVDLNLRSKGDWRAALGVAASTVSEATKLDVGFGWGPSDSHQARRCSLIRSAGEKPVNELRDGQFGGGLGVAGPGGDYGLHRDHVKCSHDDSWVGSEGADCGPVFTR